MLDITDPKQPASVLPLWQLAFRPFFLFGSLFSSLAILLWLLWLNGMLTFSPYGDAFFWHGHEMLFGFVSVFIVGFLLTAVQNWTGQRATHGMPLVLLFSLWLAGRIVFFVGHNVSGWWVALIDLSFLPLAAGYFYLFLKKADHTRNLFFVPVLLLLTLANLLFHLSLILQQPQLKVWGMNATLMLIALIMSIVAGRVMPMFTANGTGTAKVEPLAWLETLTIGSTIVLVALHAFRLDLWLPSWLFAGVFIIASVSHVYRAMRWRPWLTLKHPLLWSLHVAYWFIPVAFALFAANHLGWLPQRSMAVHALTVGAMGGMILAMICRVSLGHTGRTLTPSKWVKWILGLVILAALTRVFAGLLPFNLLNVYMAAGGLWSVAYLGFVVIYGPMLLAPRVDGRPG